MTTQLTADQIQEIAYNEARRILRMARKDREILVGQTREGTIRVSYDKAAREYAIRYLNPRPNMPVGHSRLKAAGAETRLTHLIEIVVE